MDGEMVSTALSLQKFSHFLKVVSYLFFVLFLQDDVMMCFAASEIRCFEIYLLINVVPPTSVSDITGVFLWIPEAVNVCWLTISGMMLSFEELQETSLSWPKWKY